MATNGTNNKLKRRSPATVLVIDDEPRVRDLVTRWLTADGHACSQAATAKAAWEHLQAHEVHLVTLDIRMPGDSGIDLLHQIGRSYPDTSVIMISGVEETQIAIEGADLRGLRLPHQTRQTRPGHLPCPEGVRAAAIGR